MMNFFTIAMLVLSTVLWSCAASQVQHNPIPQTGFASAQEAYEAGAYADAMRLLPLCEDQALKHEIAAYIYLKNGNVEDGLQALTRAIQALEVPAKTSREMRVKQNQLRDLHRLFSTLTQEEKSP